MSNKTSESGAQRPAASTAASSTVKIVYSPKVKGIRTQRIPDPTGHPEYEWESNGWDPSRAVEVDALWWAEFKPLLRGEGYKELGASDEEA